MKSLAASPPRNYLILNQDINALGIKKYQILSPHLPKFLPGYKSLRNNADYCHHESTDTSRTDKEYYVDNLKSINNKNSDDEYSNENL